jgi:antitoxin VapB
MDAERRVSLFRNGRNQAVRIPRDMELPGEEAILRKEGERLIIEPVSKAKSLLEYLKTAEPLDVDFPEIEDSPPEPVTVFDDFDESDLAVSDENR